MIGMRINQAKEVFFNAKAVTDAVDRAKRKVLSRFGAYVRRGARSSIRKRQSISPAGSPPSSHTGLLRKTIFFVYERDRGNVIIGPALLNKGTDAPALLEHGGSVIRTRRRKRVRMTYRPRPFMGPAFDREKPKLPRMWRDSVK